MCFSTGFSHRNLQDSNKTLLKNARYTLRHEEKRNKLSQPSSEREQQQYSLKQFPSLPSQSKPKEEMTSQVTRHLLERPLGTSLTQRILPDNV